MKTFLTEIYLQASILCYNNNGNKDYAKIVFFDKDYAQ